MKRRDAWIIVLVLAAAVALFVAAPQGRGMLAKMFGGAPLPAATAQPTAEPAPTPASEPAPGPTPGPTLSSMILSPTPAPRPTLRPAEAYVRITANGRVVALLPLIEDTTYDVRQPGGQENVVSIGPGRVSMHSSTCDNQDCVQQGEVTTDNKDMRILGNMVICLPNKVVLELLTPEEAQAAYEDMGA
ncbi:NusG domain II-containing protein [Bacillota bacterium Meth-B3]